MTWTNVTIRQRLGEAGFIETNIQPIFQSTNHDYLGTVWERNGIMLQLQEHRVYGPRLTQYPNTAIDVDPDLLGVRNVNMHGDK